MSLSSLLIIFSVLFFSINLVLFFIINILNKEYNIFKNAFSDYDIGQTHNLFQIYLWIGNLAFFAFMSAIFFTKNYSIPASIPVLLCILIVLRIGLGIFKTNIEGTKFNLTAIIHYIFAIAAFAIMYTVIKKIDARLLPNIPSHFTIAYPYFEILITIALVGVVITMFKPLRFLFGIIERIFLVLVIIWFIGTSIILISNI